MRRALRCRRGRVRDDEMPEQHAEGLERLGRSSSRSDRTDWLRGAEPQPVRQPSGHDQLPPVTRASDFAARVDIAARDGDPHAAHRADESPVMTERFDVLDFNQFVVVHGASKQRDSATGASSTSGQALVCPSPPDGQGGCQWKLSLLRAPWEGDALVPVTSARNLPAASGLTAPSGGVGRTLKCKGTIPRSGLL